MKGNVEKWYMLEILKQAKLLQKKIPVFSGNILLKTLIKYVALNNITIIC